jgi:hypothetical protein
MNRETMTMRRSTWKFGALVAAGTSLAACGGGGSSGSGTGGLSIAVTDAPVDGVTEVWVEFDAVTLKPANGGQITYTFDTPRAVNLKELTDGKVELLLDEEVPAGNYTWMKLDVNADFDGEFDSYVTEDGGGQIELRVPPDRLKLGNGFTVVQGGQTSFVIEWNLRMGLTNPVGQPGYKLQPSLRITDMAEYGTIEGTVDPTLITGGDCTSDQNSGDGNVVYLFQGAGVTPDDIDGIDPDPFTTADVRLNVASGKQAYRATFMPVGDYTVALTCQGIDDTVPDPDEPGLDVDDDLLFIDSANAAVVDGQTTTVNFDTL